MPKKGDFEAKHKIFFQIHVYPFMKKKKGGGGGGNGGLKKKKTGDN